MPRRKNLKSSQCLGGSLLLILSLCLSACGEDSHGDLKKYVKDVKSRSAYSIEPLPKQVAHHTYTYPQAPERNPFVRLEPKKAEGYSPDKSRPKEPLEAFTLDSLRMVGMMKQNNETWAVISAPDGGVYQVKVGNYIGQNYGRVSEIKDKEIKIQETVSVNGQWEKRSAEMALVEGE